MKKVEMKIGIIMAVIISAAMGLLFAIIVRATASEESLKSMPPAGVMILLSLVESIVTGVIVALVIPIGKLGKKLAARFGAAPGSMKFNLLNSIPFAVINAVLVSAVCSFISILQAHSNIPADKAPPFTAMWLGNWARFLPLSIVVSYVLAVGISPIVVKACMPKGGPGGPGMSRPGGPGAAGPGGQGAKGPGERRN